MSIIGSFASTLKGTSTTSRIDGSVALGGSGLNVNSNNQVIMGKYNIADSEDTYRSFNIVI